jgi:hypothetical protein
MTGGLGRSHPGYGGLPPMYPNFYPSMYYGGSQMGYPPQMTQDGAHYRTGGMHSRDAYNGEYEENIAKGQYDTM